MLKGARKDGQSARPDGTLLKELVHGVQLREWRNLPTRNGVTVEVFRQEGDFADHAIRHIIQVRLRGHAVSAWHCHEKQTDHLFPNLGTVRLVLFDPREDSPTRGRVSELVLTPMRPTLVSIPPLVWHGLQNLEGTESGFLNFFDHMYDYEDPDEWRLPADTDQIPYRFPAS